MIEGNKCLKRKVIIESVDGCMEGWGIDVWSHGRLNVLIVVQGYNAFLIKTIACIAVFLMPYYVVVTYSTMSSASQSPNKIELYCIGFPSM